MMRKNILGVIAALLGGVSFAQAAITLETEFATLYDANGTTPIGAGKIGILVADTDGTGITNALNSILTEGTFLGGNSDDLIVAVFSSINNVNGDPSTSGFSNISNLTYSGNFSAGDSLYLLWFPTITVAGSTVIDGTVYGIYRSDTINSASGANIAFIAPPDNGSYTLAAYLESIAPGSGVTAQDFTASQVAAVPEPSTTAILVMLGIGGILFQFRRRLKA
jgi:hypothetical protein